jgi:hypothetical protein
MKVHIALTIVLLLWAALCAYFGYIADVERSACEDKGGVVFTDGCYRVTKEKIK